MVGPLDDPDMCMGCDGFGHLYGFDIYEEEAMDAYREHLASAIEARSAETTGSARKGESAVPKAGAPETSA
jgi:hypothetical protein